MQTPFSYRHEAHCAIHGAVHAQPCPAHSSGSWLTRHRSLQSSAFLYMLQITDYSVRADLPASERFIIEYSRIAKRIHPYSFSKNNRYSINLFQLNYFSLRSFPFSLLKHNKYESGLTISNFSPKMLDFSHWKNIPTSSVVCHSSHNAIELAAPRVILLLKEPLFSVSDDT